LTEFFSKAASGFSKGFRANPGYVSTSRKRPKKGNWIVSFEKLSLNFKAFGGKGIVV
jgi:hypothetical protein